MQTQEPKIMRAVQYTPGCGPEGLRIGSIAVPTLRKREILVKVYATAINRADLLQRKGLYLVPPGDSDILGLEVAGIIEEIEGTCTGTWKPGDRVMALVGGGGYAEYAAMHEAHVMAIPEGMDFVHAAAIPEVWLTAYQLLHTIGGVKNGETVLVHDEGGGVGTAAVQLVSLVAATSIVTAGSEEKIRKAMNLGAKVGFNYHEGSFAKKVLEETAGKGADLILDCVGESYWELNMECIAVDGRWVLYGLLGGGCVNGNLLAMLLRKRVMLQATALRSRSTEYKTKLIRSFEEAALPLFSTGRLRPIVDTVLPFGQLSQAHRMLEENKNSGKVVLMLRADHEQTGDKIDADV